MWFFTEEEKELQKMCRDFARNELAPKAEHHDEHESFNIEAFKKMGEIGVLGITADPKYGGAGLGATAATIVMEEFGKACAGSTLSYLAHSMLCVNNIQNNASEEQKAKYLPKLITGEWIGCMGMSEPEFGSDAVGIQTKAEDKGDHYQINGTKMWITNAQYADIAYVYTRTGAEKKNLSTFIIEKGTPGFSVGKPIHKMGMRSSPTGELVFENARVPKANLVGNVGDSVYHMMKNLEIERVTLAAMSLGIAKRALQIMNKYARDREAFGKPLAAFGQIQKYIGDSYAEYMAARCYVYNTARQMDLSASGQRLDSDGVKIVASMMAKNVSDRAIQVLGGYGYVGEYVVERLWRDSKLLEIGGGTLEAHQKNITNDLGKMAEVLL